MSDRTHFWQVRGIVSRLRLVFLGISLVLLGALAVGAVQFRTLSRSVDQLALSSVPVFVSAADTERNLKTLLLLLQRVDGVNQLEDLGPLSAQLAGRLSILRTNIREFFDTEHSPNILANMTQALDKIDQGTTKILAETRAVLLQDNALAQKTQNLRDIGVSLRVLLEDVSFEAATSANLNLQTDSARVMIESDEVEQQYHHDLVIAHAFTEIALAVEAIIDTAVSLRNISGENELERAANTLQFKLRGVVGLIAQLEPGTARTDMASKILQIRDLIFDDLGIRNAVRDLQVRRANLDADKLAQLTPVEAISNLSNQLTDAARAQIESGKQGLTTATRQMSIILALSMFFSLVVIYWAMIFVVERQINKRMARLTNAVVAIAAGQTSYRVDVSGPDELGKMASALDVFKLNAHELHRSNAELEKFAYVAAHDLRAPLRAIQDLTEWTLEDPDNVFCEEGRENMSLVKQRIDRLNQLLQDLLEYARVGKDADHLVEVSISSVVEQTAEFLDPNGAFQISFLGPCDCVVTYATPLRQILLNLINNAIKHHDRKTGGITVKAEFMADCFSCSVHDDGPGISPKYHDKIFGLFQTLRPRDEVEGSGLGLAIIRKLLEYHDGTIRVQSDPDAHRGTCFVFEMPAKLVATQPLDQAA